MAYNDKEKKEPQGEILWKQTTQNRDNYLDRAREASLLTIPQLFPPEGSDENTKYPTPYQSLGAKGVNNLANKIILSLFPPNQAFFKLGLNPADMQKLGKSEGDVKEAMYNLERLVINEMEVSSLRPKLVNLLKQLIVGGSSVIYVPEKGSPEVFKMDSFGIKRDKQGNVLKMVLKQQVQYISLSKRIQQQLEDVPEDCKKGTKALDMYTCIIKKDENKFEVWQEIHKTRIESTYGVFDKEELPYLFVPFVDAGEDYGRSYVEDCIGDLQSYEGLRQSLLEAAAESARILYILKPNSTISLKKLRDARSGDVLNGNPEDVSTLQSEKRMDMMVTQTEANTLRQELAVTFLLDSAVRRDAERVTAEEIRQVSQELEVALGGIYSTLSNNLQAPLVKLYLTRLVAKKKIPAILKGALDLEVTTGSAALGRGADFQTLTTFVNTLNMIAQSPVTQQYLKLDELIKRIAYSLDVNTAQLVTTPEERQAMSEAASQQQALQDAAPKMLQEQQKANIEENKPS